MSCYVLTIIVTYNGLKWIDKCIQSVLSSDMPSDCFVVDNGSSDGTQELIQKKFPEVIFVQSKENLGFGKANNIGIRYAVEKGYKYIYLLNQDAYLFPDTLSNLIRTSESFPEYGILSPMQLQGNQKHFDTNYVRSVAQWESGTSVIEDLYYGRLQEVYPLKDVLAANWLITRRCFTKVGGFSTSFPHYGEDNNYCHRALFHKFKVGIATNAKAIHDTEFRTNSVQKEMYLLHMLNVSIMNNIYDPQSLPLLRTLINSIKASLAFKSFKPIMNEIKLCGNIFLYSKNRRLSRGEGAFL